MANRRDSGVFELENVCWAYRFTVKVDGVTITQRKTVDANGLKFRTKTDVIKARAAALQEAVTQRVKKKPTYRHTIKEVFEEYCENGRTDRAYQTIRKQDSRDYPNNCVNLQVGVCHLQPVSTGGRQGQEGRESPYGCVLEMD